MIDISPVSGKVRAAELFPLANDGKAGHMDDRQQTPRVNDDTAAQHQEESRSEETSIVFTARLLANPRRVRL